jgi:hypothetical protein
MVFQAIPVMNHRRTRKRISSESVSFNSVEWQNDSGKNADHVEFVPESLSLADLHTFSDNEEQQGDSKL